MRVKEIIYNPEVKNILRNSILIAINENNGLISIEHIFNSFFEIENSSILKQYKKNNKKKKSIKIPENKEYNYSSIVSSLLKKVKKQAEENNLSYINANNLLLGLLEYKKIQSICEDLSIPHTEIKEKILFQINKPKNPKKVDLSKKTKENRRESSEDFRKYFESKNESHISTIQKYCKILNSPDFLDKKCYHRSSDIDNIFKILGQKENSNVLVLGKAGIGKTNLVEGFVKEILDKRYCIFNESSVIQIDPPSLISGASLRGEFEKRLISVLEAIKSIGNCIVFIDEIHTIFNMGTGGESSLNFQNILKPYISNGSIKIIGTTTDKEYFSSIRRDAAFSNRFSLIDLEEPSKKLCKDIISKCSQEYNSFHGIKISKNNIDLLVDLCDKFLVKDNFPRKAFKFLDFISSSKKISIFNLPSKDKDEYKKVTEKIISEINIDSDFVEIQKNLSDSQKKYNTDFLSYVKNISDRKRTITKKDIISDFCSYSGVSFNQVNRFVSSQEEKNKKISDKHEIIRETIFGQDNQIKTVCKNLNRSLFGFKDPHQPLGVYMFVGPTGVGKTFLSKELAKNYFSEDSFLQINMSEYNERHSISRLIGANPGYIGYDDSNILLDFLEKHKDGVILFDEIEKAHEKVFNIFLQIFEEGQLALGDGTIVNFSNFLIILTSNIGSNFFDKDNHSVGFVSKSEDKEEKVLSEIKKNFRPEFLNRLDEILIFNKLELKEAEEIVDKEIIKFLNYADLQSKDISYSKEVVDFIIEKSDFKKYGGRNIKKTTQKEFFNPLSNHLLEEKSNKNKLHSKIKNDQIYFYTK